MVPSGVYLIKNNLSREELMVECDEVGTVNGTMVESKVVVVDGFGKFVTILDELVY